MILRRYSLQGGRKGLKKKINNEHLSILPVYTFYINGNNTSRYDYRRGDMSDSCMCSCSSTMYKDIYTEVY